MSHNTKDRLLVLSIILELEKKYSNINVAASESLYKVFIPFDYKRLILSFISKNNDLLISIEYSEPNKSDKLLNSFVVEEYDSVNYLVRKIDSIISKYLGKSLANNKMDIPTLFKQCQTIIKVICPYLEIIEVENNVIYLLEDMNIVHLICLNDFVLFTDHIDIKYHYIDIDNSSNLAKDMTDWIDVMIKHLTAKRYRYCDIGRAIVKSISHEEMPDDSISNIINFLKTNLITRNRNKLYSYSFDRLSDITVTDAIIAFEYYVATKVLDKIVEYENIFNERIVIDSKEVVESVFQMIDNDNINVAMIKGVNTNFIFVPQDVLVAMIIDKTIVYNIFYK